MTGMRWIRPRLLWGCALVFLVPACKQGKSYPTAPAPKSIKAPPPPERVAGMDAEEDDAEETPEPTRPLVGSDGPAGKGDPAPPSRASDPRPGEPPTTINGHPEGPKAEVFNAVMNNAYGAAARCLTGPAASGDGPSSLQVQVEVGNSGQVTKVAVIGGSENAALRSCVTAVGKALPFPPFKGPVVVQTLPLTFFRQADSPPSP
jgi:hypothetical protein